MSLGIKVTLLREVTLEILCKADKVVSDRFLATSGVLAALRILQKHALY